MLLNLVDRLFTKPQAQVLVRRLALTSNQRLAEIEEGLQCEALFYSTDDTA